MNKILVTVYIPLLDEVYDIFIPINKKVGTVKKAIITSVKNLVDQNYRLLIEDNCKIADDNVYIKNSGIRNGSKLVLL